MSAFASRIANLKPEGAYKVMARAQELERQGRSIIHLEIGQPDFATFPEIREAGKQAIDEGFTRYNPTSGYNDLRDAISQEAGARREIYIDPECVVVGPGAKPGLVFPLLAFLEKGDEVLYPDPGFPTYRAAIEMASATPVPVPLIESRSFSFDLDALRDKLSAKTKLIILNAPANPTGGIIPQDDLNEIARIAQERNIWILSDEIYGRLVYSGKQNPSILSLPGMLERTILVDGFSKSYAMTGWRLGFTIMPKALAEKVSLLLTHTIGCTAGFTQKAGVAALQHCDAKVDAIVEDYQKRRDLIVSGLNEIQGISCQLPDGAFYAFPNIKETGLASSELATKLLEEAGIACLPGTDFGRGGEGYLRLCYAAPPAEIRSAIEAIKNFMEKIR